MQNAEKYVYSVKSATLSNNQGALNVSGFSLVLAHNGIPRLRVTADPTFDAGAPGTRAVVASMSAFVAQYISLQEVTQSADMRKCSFSFTAENAAGDTQTLDVKDWILTGAGFSGISASGALQLTLELQHPAVLANESTVNLFGFKVDPQLPPDIEGIDLHDGICRCMQAYLDLVDPENLTEDMQADEKFKFLVDRYAKALEAFQEHYRAGDTLTWPSLPFASLAELVPLTIWDYVLGMGSQTLWDWFSHTVLSDYHASILPTYWDALEIAPYEPWGDPQVTVIDTDVADFTLPPADPAPVCGAYCMMGRPELQMLGSSIESKDGMSSQLSDAAFWVEKDLPGAVRGFNLPAWMWGLLSLQGSADGAQGSSVDDGNRMNTPANATEAKEGLGEYDPMSMDELRTAAETMAEQIFIEDFRRSLQISLKCRLMLQSENSQLPGQAVIPGYVFELAPGGIEDLETEGGGQPLRFFATQIEHTVDCMQKTAYTRIIGSYLRQGSGPVGVEAIPGGSQINLLY